MTKKINKISRDTKDRFINYITKIWEIIKKPEMGILPGQLAFFMLLSLVPIITLSGYAAGLFNINFNTIIDMFGKIVPGGIDTIVPYLNGNTIDLKLAIKMLEVLSLNNVGLVGPQILELGSIHRGMRELTPTMDFLLTVPILKNLISDNAYQYEEGHYEKETSNVDVISSCFFLISSEVLEKINYMDESVFLYYEDFILSKKIRNLGLDIVVQNEVKVKHLYSVSVDRIVKNVDKYKMLKKSQFYYHTTYNNANKAERILLKVNAFLGVLVRKIKKIFHK